MNADSEEEHYEFNDDELEEFLTQVEKLEFFTEEEAHKFLEEKHAEIQKLRIRPTRSPKKVRTGQAPDIYDDFLKEPQHA